MVDKYEYKLKFEQMKALTAGGDYEAAAEIADTIHWRKVKNINLLIKAGDIYFKLKRFEDAKEILQMAYDRTPIGRMIIYRLAEIAVKMKNFEEAESYYNEFVEIAPHDNLKYVLRYKISKAKGADILTRIAILEELKDAEYTEEWAFELAYLYHKAGEYEKCIDVCDELILWFGDGIYVEKALELKLLHKPLTKPQEDKYLAYRQHRDGVKEVYPQEEAVQIPPEDELDPVEEFDKSVLQAEPEHEEPEPVKGPEDIMDLLADIIPRFDTGAASADLAQEGVSLSDSEPVQKRGRLHMDSRIRRPESRQSDAESEESDLLRKIKRAKPQFREQLGERQYIPRRIRQPDISIPPEEEMPAEDETYVEQPAELSDFLDTENKSASDETISEGDMPYTQESVFFAENRKSYTERQQIIDSEGYEEFEAEPDDPIPEEEDVSEEQPAQEEEDETPAQEELRAAEAEFYGVPVELLPEESEEEQGSLVAEMLARQDTKEIKAKQIEEALDKHAREMLIEDEVTEAISVGSVVEPESESLPEITKLDDEMRDIFSYFVPVAGMESQICQVLTKTRDKFTGRKSSAEENILIQGGRGCGKTILATRLVRALKKESQCKDVKIGNIDAEKLNQKDLAKLLDKISGGCLIIERAGEITRETAIKLSLLLENDDTGILVIMEDTRVGLEEALKKDEGFAKKFSQRIIIPVFTSDELVEFGNAYAHERDYEIDNMGVLALYNRISNIQRLDQPTTLIEIKDIIDEAIERAEKKSWKKAFSILTSKRYSENDYIILREKDFEE